MLNIAMLIWQPLGTSVMSIDSRFENTVYVLEMYQKDGINFTKKHRPRFFCVANIFLKHIGMV